MTSHFTSDELAARRRQLVEALRSGEYEQTKKYLHDAVGYCCMGVACELSGLGEWASRDDSVHRFKIGDRPAVDLDTKLPPPRVWDYYGFRNPQASFKVDGLPAELRESIERYSTEVLFDPQLTDLNDNGASFELIASIIEAEPEGLFYPGVDPD